MRRLGPLQGVRDVFAYAKRWARSGYGESIVRRTAILCGLVIPGFAANFFVYFFAAQALPADQFGLFYVALTIVNVIYSGSNILNVFLTRHLVRVGESSGNAAIIATSLRIERNIILVGAACGASVFLALLVAARQIGVQSPIVILMIVLDSYTAYVTDLGRVLLQSLRKTLSLGFYTAGWMILRLMLCLAGIVVFGTVWGAFAGIVLSTVTVFIIFHLWVWKLARGTIAQGIVALPLLTLIPAALGFGLLVLVSNLDVLASYFLLGDADLGVYSASSVLPKAALVVITPLLQMLIPMMVSPMTILGTSSKRRINIVIGKIGGFIFAATALGSVLVWLASDWVCGSRWGLKLCQPSLLGTLLLSVVPLALLRTLVILEFAWRRDLYTLWLTIPVLGYGAVLWLYPKTMGGLASGFAMFSIFAFVFFVAVCLIVEFGRKRAWRAVGT